MSLIIEQTLPYKPSELQLDDPQRWARLLPLIRPSIRIIQVSQGNTVAIDTAIATSSGIPVAVIGNNGNFSSKILGESKVAALVIQEDAQDNIPHETISKALKENGFDLSKGLVVLKSAQKSNVTSNGGLVEVDVESALQFDHVLSLLSSSKDDIKSDLEALGTLLNAFITSAKSTKSTLHEKKSGDAPSVIHAIDIAEFNSAKAAVDKDISHLLDSQASSNSSKSDIVYSVHFADINGLSRLENNILAHEISEYFARQELSSYITHSSILDHQNLARGWAISLCPLSKNFLSTQEKPNNTLANTSSSTGSLTSKPREVTSRIRYSDSQIRTIVTAGCEKVIASEATITEYDTIVGDGDCGYTLRDGAKQVLSFIHDRDLSQFPRVLGDLVDDLEVNMGGTSGALYCIFLSSLSQNLWDAPNFAAALKQALDHLLEYTRARLGDRTCLDCLIPFVDTLEKTGDTKGALKEAEAGVESTKKLEAKLGRSSYLDEAATRGVPDPGAYGLFKLLEGMVGGN